MALLSTDWVSESAAQESGPAVIQLPPVTVTARKRDEVEQDVPISMTVLEGQRLDVPTTASNSSLARSAPNVNFVDVGGQSANLFSIRGVGSFSPLSADDTSSVMYVGEAPQSLYGASPSLLDVDRVEILRGPQGTLFGRNTQAGAINIVPRQATFDRELSATGELGSQGYGLGEFIANTPLIQDRLAGRLAMRYSTFGGDIPNIVVGGEDGAIDVSAARGSLLFAPSDRTTANLAVSYNRFEDTSPRFLLRDYADFPTSAVNPRTEVDSDSLGVNLKINHQFESVVFDSVTTLQRNTSFQQLDPVDGLVFAKLTGLPASAFNIAGSDLSKLDIDENIYTQEFRLSSPRDRAVAWTAGVNFFRSEVGMDREGQATTPAFATTRGLMNNEFTTNSYSAFGEVTVPVIDRLKATLGLRATHEDKTASYRFNGNGQPGVVPAFSQDGDLSDDFLTGRAALSYDWSANLMTYASVGRGYVTPGFPAVAVNSPLGKPETSFPASTSWTYETGFKSTFLDERLGLRGALFFNDVKQGHLVAFNAASALFLVAPIDYQSYGGELEVTARPVPELELFGGAGYTHAELVDVPAGSATGARSGNEVPNAPAFTANLGAQYRLSGQTFRLPGDFVGRAVWQYMGTRAADVANSFDLESYSVVNLRLGWEGERFDFYAFANNLFDERYEAWGQSFGVAAPTVRVGQGRIVGVGTTIRF